MNELGLAPLRTIFQLYDTDVGGKPKVIQVLDVPPLGETHGHENGAEMPGNNQGVLELKYTFIGFWHVKGMQFCTANENKHKIQIFPE